MLYNTPNTSYKISNEYKFINEISCEFTTNVLKDATQKKMQGANLLFTSSTDVMGMDEINDSFLFPIYISMTILCI